MGLAVLGRVNGTLSGPAQLGEHQGRRLGARRATRQRLTVLVRADEAREDLAIARFPRLGLALAALGLLQLAAPVGGGRFARLGALVAAHIRASRPRSMSPSRSRLSKSK